MGRPPLQSAPFSRDALDGRATSSTEPEQKRDGAFRLAGTEEGGPDTGVSRPPREGHPELLSGDGTRGAPHGLSPT